VLLASTGEGDRNASVAAAAAAVPEKGDDAVDKKIRWPGAGKGVILPDASAQPFRWKTVIQDAASGMTGSTHQNDWNLPCPLRTIK
jgi:hypothetical protein